MTEEAHDAHPEERLVPVLNTTNSAVVPVVRSVLDAAGIPYSIQGEETMGMLPMGPGNASRGRVGLGVQVLVPEDRAEEAKALLAEGDTPVGE